MHERLEAATSKALGGGPPKYHDKLRSRGRCSCEIASPHSLTKVRL